MKSIIIFLSITVVTLLSILANQKTTFDMEKQISNINCNLQGMEKVLK